MNEKETTAYLLHHNVKPTANRIVVVKALEKSDRPLTMRELEEKILSIDKSGIFRTLSLFRDHHIVHVIDGEEGGVRYELCRSSCHEQCDDSHVHFYCELCHRTYCLTDLSLPAISLPAGYRPTSANYIIHGICPNCGKTTKR